MENQDRKQNLPIDVAIVTADFAYAVSLFGLLF
jgi:hypothetical protein